MFPNQLYTIFELVKESPYTKGFSQEFGEIYLNRVSSYPHVVWVPSSDSYSHEAIYQAKEIIYTTNSKNPNTEYHLFQFMTRNAGCQLHIFHNDFKKMESMIICIVNAIYNACISLTNFSINSGNWDYRTQTTENAFKYVLDFSFEAPIYRFQDLSVAETLVLTDHFI